MNTNQCLPPVLAFSIVTGADAEAQHADVEAQRADAEAQRAEFRLNG